MKKPEEKNILRTTYTYTLIDKNNTGRTFTIHLHIPGDEIEFPIERFNTFAHERLDRGETVFGYSKQEMIDLVKQAHHLKDEEEKVLAEAQNTSKQPNLPNESSQEKIIKLAPSYSNHNLFRDTGILFGALFCPVFTVGLLLNPILATASSSAVLLGAFASIIILAALFGAITGAIIGSLIDEIISPNDTLAPIIQ